MEAVISSYFIKGLVIAVIFGVPAGAVGALTIQRTVERGFLYGFVTGMGSSAADLVYAAIAVFGITAVSDFLISAQIPIRLIGCVLIMMYGIMILVSKDKKKRTDSQDKRTGLFSCFASSFAVAILNPATILSFAVAFTSFGITGDADILQGLLLMAGILIGTGIWWLGLSAVVTLFRMKISDSIYRILNICLGTLLILLSIGIVVSIVIEG